MGRCNCRRAAQAPESPHGNERRAPKDSLGPAARPRLRRGPWPLPDSVQLAGLRPLAVDPWGSQPEGWAARSAPLTRGSASGAPRRIRTFDLRIRSLLVREATNLRTSNGYVGSLALVAAMLPILFQHRVTRPADTADARPESDRRAPSLNGTCMDPWLAKHNARQGLR